MKVELNKLTEEDRKELEKFIILHTDPQYKDYAEKFAEYLNSNKIKNNEFDINMLDKIYEGLTDIVMSWFAEHKFVGKTFSLEDLVCAPGTRVGKFLETYNKPQISLNDGITIMKEKETLIDALMLVADIQLRQTRFSLDEYDLNHIKRTIFMVNMLIALKNNLSDREKRIVLKAVEFHDIGRIHEYNDVMHGERAVSKLKDELDEFTDTEKEIVKFLIREHCKPSIINDVDINRLNKSEEAKKRIRIYLNYVKDSDKLDRVRYPEVSPVVANALEPTRLHMEESKQLIKFACELLECYDVLLNVNNGETAENFKKHFVDFSAIQLSENARNEILEGLKNEIANSKKEVACERAETNSVLDKNNNNITNFINNPKLGGFGR